MRRGAARTVGEDELAGCLVARAVRVVHPRAVSRRLELSAATVDRVVDELCGGLGRLDKAC